VLQSVFLSVYLPCTVLAWNSTVWKVDRHVFHDIYVGIPDFFGSLVGLTYCIIEILRSVLDFVGQWLVSNPVLILRTVRTVSNNLSRLHLELSPTIAIRRILAQLGRHLVCACHFCCVLILTQEIRCSEDRTSWRLCGPHHIVGRDFHVTTDVTRLVTRHSRHALQLQLRHTHTC